MMVRYGAMVVAVFSAQPLLAQNDADDKSESPAINFGIVNAAGNTSSTRSSPPRPTNSAWKAASRCISKATSRPGSMSRLAMDYMACRLAGHYRRSLLGAAFLLQEVEFLPNFEQRNDFRINTETALVAPISRTIGLKLGYTFRYDNMPGQPATPHENGNHLHKSDRLLTAGLRLTY